MKEGVHSEPAQGEENVPHSAHVRRIPDASSLRHHLQSAREGSTAKPTGGQNPFGHAKPREANVSREAEARLAEKFMRLDLERQAALAQRTAERKSAVEGSVRTGSYLGSWIGLAEH
jgi:hypothetical protein